MFNVIQVYVELLDKHFGSVCELDIVFEFQQAYSILDEFLLAGHVQESSKEKVKFNRNIFDNRLPEHLDNECPP